MKTFTFPMLRKNKSYTSLKDILNILPENNWTWSILDFDGIGKMPQDMSIDEFIELIKKNPSGLMMSWEELKNFSNSIEQTFDCLIVAVLSMEKLDGSKFIRDNFSDCLVVINAFDSSEWTVSIQENSVPLMVPLNLRE
jgi:hypothetical protein